jgi:hypothetical protein
MQKLVPFPLAFPDLWPAPAAAIVRLRTALALVVVEWMERSAGWSCQPFPSSFLSFHRPISTDSYRRERSKQGKHLPFTGDGWVRLVFHLPDPSTTRMIQQPPLQTTVCRYGFALKQARARVPLSCFVCASCLPPTVTESKPPYRSHTQQRIGGTQCNYQKTWKHSDGVHSSNSLLLYAWKLIC